MTVFFDASALIYLIEGEEPLAQRARTLLKRLGERHPALRTAVSRLAWLECRVRPARRGDTEVVAAFDAFFALPSLVWVDLTQDVVELATAIRVRHGLRPPDALHAASCLQCGTDHVFMTGDAAFKKVTALNVHLLH